MLQDKAKNNITFLDGGKVIDSSKSEDYSVELMDLIYLFKDIEK